MRSPRHLLLACAVVALPLTACSTAATTPTSRPVADGGSPAAQAALAPGAVMAEFGVEHRFGSGISVLVAPPRLFQPSETAYPKCARAASFQIDVRNQGAQPFRLSNLFVSAMAGQKVAKQLYDVTHGYNGIADATRDVAPGDSVRVSLAFALPKQPTELRVTVRPDPDSQATATYRGSV